MKAFQIYNLLYRVLKWLKNDLCYLPALRILRTLIINDNKFVDFPQVEEFISTLVVSFY